MTSQVIDPEQARFQPRLRAMIEITEQGELRIFPVASSDGDERRILEALRLIRDDSSKVVEG